MLKISKQNTSKNKISSDEIIQKVSKTRFFQELFIYFFIFSWAGHYFEAIWAWIMYLTVDSKWYPVVKDIIPLAAPYGLGVVGLILFVLPVVKKYKMHPIFTFFYSGFICSVIEFICAVLIVAIYGRNYFWDYSKLPYNLFGYVCLGNFILFSIGSVIFIYFIYQRCDKFIKSFKDIQISKIFWILFLAFFINQTLIFIREFVK